MSTDLDKLKVVATTALCSLFTSRKVTTPITSKDLLVRVITFRLPDGLFPGNSPPPRFRLTDLSRFEAILEDLSHDWDKADISFRRENGEFMVMDVTFPTQFPEFGAETTNTRKRKRVIDEEADSAAGDEPDELLGEDGGQSNCSGLAGFSKEQREVYAVIQKETAKGRLLAEQFHSREETFEPICPHITKDECAKARRLEPPFASLSSSAPVRICDRVHFRPLIRPHTDPTLGHCSYLNTCYSEPTYSQSPSIPPFPGQGHVLAPGTRGPASLPSGLGAGGRGKEKAPCRYLHYEVDWDGSDGDASRLASTKSEDAVKKHRLNVGMGPTGKTPRVLPPQWINCDLRRFDYSVLGKFHVIMADPPWDIHMSLPYGTMTDDEMRAMPIPALQDEGLLFLWVTGRAMEVGRECLRVWGYTRVDEVVWVKTNQLQRVIRTGRTGHWLNHTKEHMLVGVKTVTDSNGNLKFPSWANRGLDTDVIVSEVRETSRKPDEVYGLIERMCPGGRKIEIFGRKHNTRPGWLTLGNQLGPDQIYEKEFADRIMAKYPDRTINIQVEN
ncbi:MT-A70-domain-containing protein [Dendrothele bispora CBS 962.96]|uniref:mRNA m(6)A methyltransferase n=1 Tax=Dendrothele bispora (strain CBS 962.96) TaxID=1314807 RepID=A0A4V4HI80_DENBC|nr:MT-A70-domain-containing protein [Dendrothele bispora CBS 962.96]